MSNVNIQRLFFISCLSYALTGGLVIVTGMVMGDIANYFGVPVTSMSNTFTFLNAGILIAIFLNVWLMEVFALKKQLIFGFFLIVLAVAGLFMGKSLIVFSACMFVLGTVSGITMSIGTFLITQLYEGRQRGARLLFTDSFFSMAGTILPIIAAALLSRHLGWYWVYGCIALLYVGIMILTLMSDFPIIGKKRSKDDRVEVLANDKTPEKWGVSVVLLSIAALCYILGQLAFIQWVPEYATKSLGMDIGAAGALVSSFWTSYMLGMWGFSYVLKFFDLQRVVTVLAGLATAGMFIFITSDQSHLLKYFIFGLGFISSAIYTTLITLGSQQTEISSPKLVNFILTCGTVGTMLTFVVTGPVVEHFGVHAALVTANCLYLTVFALCFILGFFTKHRLYSNPEAH
ncbi:MFS transporter TsgA [Serratia plymuthica]|uniref:MFS transporter TsgA n=1 Tax=Serratia plymuthica TaxID=82996 RepID=A0A2X4V9S4_SERPL|nr:MFS transporter TsgA [Serratia plymuthica]QPS20118.1 MFS transporter TsgA [Serratia plymuthica]QPS57719.1 MFS transporter TsgA [Serratia plymuthica]QPS61733.1 MFS transporter TsgA [Serratia plymuthica]RKS61180.1 TsgA-like MFS transporter [Serratia plymuthica]UNK29889.1 MFS transporter TsgA [Serratia plymuthica]